MQRYDHENTYLKSCIYDKIPHKVQYDNKLIVAFAKLSKKRGYFEKKLTTTHKQQNIQLFKTIFHNL